MRPQLRFATAGSVDDGKSTLIGRLLHDTKAVFEDQLAAVERASLRYGDGDFNLALLIDGLKAERQQGITIDVAYRYFATEQREFVIADTPGHAEYTRNMVTGASVSDAAIVLVDARNGVSEQTRRHLFISSLLGVQEIILAINKMDLVGWDEGEFDRVVKEASDYVDSLAYPVSTVAIPISALHGDNVVDPSAKSPWYDGPSLLSLLESLDIKVDGSSEVGTRLPVQWTIPLANGSRLFAGQLTGGGLSVGDKVEILPSGKRSLVKRIERFGDAVSHADPGRSVAVQLDAEIDVGRGDVLVPMAAERPATTREIEADVCWMIDSPLTPGSRWQVKHLTQTVRATVTEISHRSCIETLEELPAEQLGLNDIGRISLSLTGSIVADPYLQHRDTGRFILIDEATNTTAAAGMIR